MELIKLNQTNGRPRAFYGVEIFNESNKQHDSVRWTNVRIYKEDIGGYRIGIARLTCFDNERDDLTASPNIPTKEEAVEFVSDHAAEFTEKVTQCLYPKRKMKNEPMGSKVEQKPF